jgi:hypothetical protein
VSVHRRTRSIRHGHGHGREHLKEAGRGTGRRPVRADPAGAVARCQSLDLDLLDLCFHDQSRVLVIRYPPTMPFGLLKRCGIQRPGGRVSVRARPRPRGG